MRSALLAVVLVLGLPAGASAQAVAVAFFGIGDEGVVLSSKVAPVRASGGFEVEWESDPETCAAVGRCGLRGTMTWQAPRAGQLVLATVRHEGAITHRGFVVTSGDDMGVRAVVRRATATGSRVCTDIAPEGPALNFEEDGGAMTLGFTDGDLFRTRCAGPVLADLAPLLPPLRTPYPVLARGRTTLRLGGDGTFVAHGLRGRVRSTVEFAVGRTRTVRAGEALGARLRVLQVGFRVAEVGGELVTSFSYSPECAPLDTCLLSGSVTTRPAVTSGEASLTAFARASRARQALRATLGLVPGGERPGVQGVGFALWEGGSATTTVGRDGDAPCTDEVDVPGGLVGLEVVGTRVRVEYGPQSPRTRCPGPLASGPVLRAELPLRAFAQRRVELQLSGEGSLGDDGWTGSARGSLRVVLERTAVEESVVPVRR